MASYKSVGFGDERRMAADNYRPPRARIDRSERDKISGRRPPPETALRLNTDVPTPSRTQLSPPNATPAQMSPPKDSPSSAGPSIVRDRPPSGAIPSRTTTPTIPCPKASDPALQGTFEVLYKACEIQSKRSLLAWQRERKKKEMEARRAEASSTPPSFHSLREVQKIQRTRDEEELKALTEKSSPVDSHLRATLEAFAAIIQQTQSPASVTSAPPTAPPTTDPDLAIKVADLEKKHCQAQDEIQKLQTARPQWTDLEKKLSQAQEAIMELRTDREKTTEVCRALMSKQNELEKDNSALAVQNAQLKEKVANLEGDYVEMRNALSSKASNVDLMEAKASAQSLPSDSGNVQQDIQRLSLTIEELKSRATTTDTILETVESNFSSLQNTVSEASTGLSSMRCSVSKVEDYVKTIQGTLSRADTELAALQSTVSRVGTDVTAVQGRVSTAESDLATIKEHTDNLDFKTLDDMGDKWAIHNIGDSVPKMKEKLEELENNGNATKKELNVTNKGLEDLKREVSEMADLPNPEKKQDRQQVELNRIRQELSDHIAKCNQNEHVSRVVQEPTPPVPDDDLKKQIVELKQKTQMDLQAVQEQIIELKQKTQMQLQAVQDNFHKLRKYTDDSMIKQGDLFGAMLDDISRRVEELEGARRSFGDLIEGLSPRVTNLENMANEPNASCENVKIKLGVVEQSLAVVDQKLAALPDTEARATAQRDLQDLNQKVKAVEIHRDDDGRRLDSLALGLEALNEQLGHITTRPLFELIVRHVDQNYQRYGPRISSLETKLMSTQNDVERALQRLDNKRSASPASQTAENGAKRRRVAN